MYVKLVGAMFTLLFLMCVIHVRGENSIVKDPLVKLVVKFTDNLRHVVDKTMADYNFTFYRKVCVLLKLLKQVFYRAPFYLLVHLKNSLYIIRKSCLDNTKSVVFSDINNSNN